MSSTSLRLAAPATQKESEGVEAFKEGLNFIRKLVSDEENIVILPEAFYLRGFVHDMFTEYKEFSVIRTRPGGVIIAHARATGRYYPAFIMYDAQGEPNQVVTIFVGDERKGVAVARSYDNRSYVFVLSEPCDFKRGASITLMTPDSPGGTYRVEKILLLKKKPPKMRREYLFTDVNAVPVSFEDGVKVRATWITNWVTSSRVEYGLSTEYEQSAEDEDVLNNHRLVLTGLEKGRTYHYRLVGRTPDGVDITSQDYTITTSPKKKPEGRVERDMVPLHVRNELPVRREKWPVTSGVPFPKGALSSPENVRVLNPAGEEAPVQASVLGEWPDGSVKWLLVDFQADVDPKSQAEYRLEFGRKVLSRKKEPKSRIVVTRKDSTVELNTGPLRLLINGDEPSFPGRVWLDLDGDGVFSDDEEVTDPAALGVMELVDAGGKVYTSLRGPCRVEVEEEGPLRTVVKIVGEHEAEDGGRLFSYVSRVVAYAGKSYIKVFHTWENNHLDEDFTTIKSLMLKTPLRLKRPICTLLGEDGRVYRSNGEPVLSQNLDDEYTVEEEGTVKERGKMAKGLIDLSDGEWGLTVGVRDFWQNYPKSLGVDGDAVVVGICPLIPKGLYPPSPPQEDKLYYYLVGGEYKLKQGVSKTHELLYYFHKGDSEEARSEDYVGFLEEPLLAVAPTEWYCESKAFGDVAVVNREKFPYYEDNISKALEDYLKNRVEGKEYGMLNFGDWWGERGYDWGNMEYDTPHAFLLQYIRSGNFRFFKAGEEAARHYMDVDTCHYNRDKRWVGTVYAHCLCHVGDYYPNYYRKGAISRGLGTVSHTWTQGLIDYYFLTGCKRSIETARKIADKYNRYHTVNYDFTNCRIPGWHLILTMAVYNATGDEFYLNAAKIIVRRVLERQTPGVGGWLRQMMPGHCHCIPRHRGNADFMVGILLSGLKLYHQATGDEAVADSIVKGAEFLIKDMWVPEVKGFRYTSCPRSSPGRANTLMLEGTSYAYRLSGKELFRDVVLKAIKPACEAVGFGKTISSQTRVAPHILYDIENYMMEKG